MIEKGGWSERGEEEGEMGKEAGLTECGAAVRRGRGGAAKVARRGGDEGEEEGGGDR